MTRNYSLIALSVLLTLAACSRQDEAAKQKLIGFGFSDAAASKLSTMGLTPSEIDNLAQAKKGGLDDNAAIEMVQSVHDRDLKFDIGPDIQLMVPQGIGSTPLVQLVQMGAIPRWGDDIRSLKDAGVGDVTIVEIAKLRFKEKKDVLSGGEYGRLKRFGMSDSGVLQFARKGGNAQQLQKAVLALQLGKSEQQALAEAGM